MRETVALEINSEYPVQKLIIQVDTERHSIDMYLAPGMGGI